MGGSLLGIRRREMKCLECGHSDLDISRLTDGTQFWRCGGCAATQIVHQPDHLADISASLRSIAITQNWIGAMMVTSLKEEFLGTEEADVIRAGLDDGYRLLRKRDEQQPKETEQ